MSSLSEFNYQDYFHALLSGNKNKCIDIVNSLLDQGMPVVEIYEHLFRRSLYQIGDLWAKNQISVAEEHIATAITENLMSQVQAKRSGKVTFPKRVIVSCVTSDYHQIGARMAANLFELSGWESYYLGANMPISDLLQAIVRIHPDLICLSLVLIEHLKTLEITVKEIRTIHPATPIIVGGGAFNNLDPNRLEISQIPRLHIVQSILQLERLIELYSGNPSE